MSKIGTITNWETCPKCGCAEKYDHISTWKCYKCENIWTQANYKPESDYPDYGVIR